MKIFGIRVARESTVQREISSTLENYKWDRSVEARAEFRAAGYSCWLNSPPPKGSELLLMRSSWHLPVARNRDDVSPETCVGSLFWKYQTSKDVDELERMYLAKSPEGK